MIFAVDDHIEMIKAGQKTETRRQSDYYKVGRTYSIQPGRGKAGIVEGRIRIINKRRELPNLRITKEDAWDEGHYTPLQFERMYQGMYSGWSWRYAYTFEYVLIKNYSQKRLSK